MTLSNLFKTFALAAIPTLGLAVWGQPAQALLISGVTATTDMGEGFTTTIVNTVNGQGLPGNVPSLTGDHATATRTNAWISVAGTTTGTITFDLHSFYSLTGFSFWNYNDVNTLGIQDVNILFSTNNVNYYPLLGAPTSFAIANNAAPTPPEIFAVTQTNARYVRFDVTSNHGGTLTAFSEVQFEAASAVPWETDVLPLLGSTLLLGGALGLKRRFAKPLIKK